ncbi:hypothetical protein [Pseudorhodoferax aquiterrae]|uniref:hypothetical protein n=1 Tax=Pseudorhodoferax aquiterrae TaxID=747304 RepID=UPI0016757944|nr:hypothetical protein [Pseudorhodoferax aquiterrae]
MLQLPADSGIAALGLLFVNVSIGGAPSSLAAPPLTAIASAPSAAGVALLKSGPHSSGRGSVHVALVVSIPRGMRRLRGSPVSVKTDLPDANEQMRHLWRACRVGRLRLTGADRNCH